MTKHNKITKQTKQDNTHNTTCYVQMTHTHINQQNRQTYNLKQQKQNTNNTQQHPST